VSADEFTLAFMGGWVAAWVCAFIIYIRSWRRQSQLEVIETAARKWRQALAWVDAEADPVHEHAEYYSAQCDLLAAAVDACKEATE
jgi:hypothetical protein